ncbi:MAG TPA: hypothetical protein ENI17_11050 [Pseudomonas xinjiangensis]|uniref:TubC N-terminal docking domain-containing protein n=2 Tax=root TaxID=1 RepID=A0A7V1BLH0_9GAMM|nr:hypothetical protein [Halopseudomonas xinjiangensis]HEC48148.1 hypothetical protein [Halopseudomonas xinjiangensis]
MAAIDYLREQGLTAQRVGSRVRLKPKGLITEDVRQYVKKHRLVLLAELAANDGEARRMSWKVIRDGRALCTMIGEPTTYHEAQEIARWRWPDAEILEN